MSRQRVQSSNMAVLRAIEHVFFFFFLSLRTPQDNCIAVWDASQQISKVPLSVH